MNESEVRDQVEETSRRAKQGINDARSHLQSNMPGSARETMRKAEDMPDTAYLAASFAFMAISALLVLMKKRELGIFVGLWPPTLISLAWMMKQRRPSHEIG